MATRYSFLDDYSEGCHPSILAALANTNLVQQTAYGEDDYSKHARTLIQAQLGKPDIPVFFVAGGTLANIIVMASCLRPHEAIIASHIGHISVRETGAIEATGHKIIAVTSADGKLYPEQLETALANNAHFPHMAKPRLVYISNATETGTIYTKKELIGLSQTCRKHGLLLMMDGARLGAALTAPSADLCLQEITELTDIFWIGGTKSGALLGEAIVIPNKTLAEDFTFHIKQRGALLAKGRLLGLQFQTLFQQDLFFELAGRANQLAQRLSTAIVLAGHELAAKTESNQVFAILPNTTIAELKASFDFYIWEAVDEQHSVIRLVTSWATDEDQLDAFIERLGRVS